MRDSSFPRWPVLAVMAAGVVLHLVEVGEASRPASLFVLFMFAYGLVPYLAAGGIAWLWRGLAFPAFLGGLAALALDLVAYYDVFVAPGSSTAAIGLLFAPAVCVVFGLLPGLLVGYLLQRVFVRRQAHP